MKKGNDKEVQKIKIAIIGAGRVGVSFAKDLLNSDEAAYIPRCFIDINEKIVYEIKPSTLVDDAKVQAKSKAAMEWCASNDYTFIVVTELTESCLQDENKKYKRD